MRQVSHLAVLSSLQSLCLAGACIWGQGSFDRQTEVAAKMHSPDCALLRRQSHGQALSSGLNARCPSLRQLTHSGSPRHCPAQRLPQLFQPRAAITATPAPLDVKNFDGGAAGSAELSLKVAPPPSAKGLVHRYVTYVLQNARAVSLAIWSSSLLVQSRLKGPDQSIFGSGYCKHQNQGRGPWWRQEAFPTEEDRKCQSRKQTDATKTRWVP